MVKCVYYILVEFISSFCRRIFEKRIWQRRLLYRHMLTLLYPYQFFRWEES